MDDQCKHHSGILARQATTEGEIGAIRDELLRVWQEIETRLPNKIFWFFLSILAPILGGLLWLQISICSDIAVIKAELSHINQIKQSESTILNAIREDRR